MHQFHVDPHVVGSLQLRRAERAERSDRFAAPAAGATVDPLALARAAARRREERRLTALPRARPLL